MPSGLSPRVRGNLAQKLCQVAPGGSIPACAGEPSTLRASSTRSKVYPRVCGGTAAEKTDDPIPQGLSPRVRGNPGPRVRRSEYAGSIPACAGEPYSSRNHHEQSRVYPRVCGGTSNICSRHLSISGLSPRVRGNPVSLSFRIAALGSIPACAGEP